MNKLFSKIEWRKQALSLIAIFVSLSILGISLYFNLDSQSKLESASIEFQSQLSLNQEAQSAYSLLNSHAQAFSALKKKGVVGEPQRLQWIELTERLSRELAILLVDFTLGKTKPADEISSKFHSYDISVFTTTMDFEISLRHEGEFYKFMEALRLNAKSLFDVKECQILRNPISAGFDPELVGLNAKCQVIWYTIDDVSNDWEIAHQ